jgi:PAS domain S-box-containing protein
MAKRRRPIKSQHVEAPGKRNRSSEVKRVGAPRQAVAARERDALDRALYQAVFEWSDDPIITKTLDGVILSWNPAAERLYGYRKDEVLGRSVSMLTPRDHAEEIPQLLDRLKRGERVEHFLTTRLRKDGRLVRVSLTVSPIKDARGRSIAAAAIARDVTAQQLAAETLARSQAQFRDFATRLRAAHEADRAFVAREIHDELGQTLTALKMDLHALPEWVPAEHREVLVSKVRDTALLIDGMVDRVRALAADLRPAVMDNQSLSAAIEWSVQRFARRSGIRCALELPPTDVHVDAGPSTDLFRILQEALTNVARHARATEVNVRLQVTPDELVLDVRDNGRGITDGERDDLHAFGLLGMRERALLWGGDVEFLAFPQGGTSVKVGIPRSRDARPALP